MKEKIIEHTDLYAELRKYRGSFSEIARRTKTSREWVRVVLKGEWPDPKVIKKAAQVLIERKKEDMQSKKLIELALAS